MYIMFKERSRGASLKGTDRVGLIVTGVDMT